MQLSLHALLSVVLILAGPATSVSNIVFPACLESQSTRSEHALHNLEMVLPQTKPKPGDKYRAPRTELDVAGYPVAPEGLSLEQVHVYMRHGACRVAHRV